MSLLLIVLLLDKSHLELVEDVLKEINFNDADWKQLGQKLGVHDERLDYIYSKDSSNLKKCLRTWLSAIRHDDPPTLDGLAIALKSIGYIEAGEYIIKTCKLIIMFNDQCY